MYHLRSPLGYRQSRRGAVIVLVAVLLPVILTLLAFSINVSYMELARTELQVATDAAARAGGRTYALTGSTAEAIAIAKNAASRHNVAGTPLTLRNSDFTFGVASRAKSSSQYTFTPSSGPCNALSLTARRTTGSANGPVTMLLPSILTTSSFQPRQTAIATQAELDVALVLDRSGSMAYANDESSNTYSMPAAAPAGWTFGYPAPDPCRWRDAALAVDAFLNVLDQTPLQERLSLVTYSDNPIKDVGLTTNYSYVDYAVAYYTAQFMEGSTNIGGGISTAINSLNSDSEARSWASKVIVLLTDGIHNTGYDPVSAAYEARDNGITIHTVTFSQEADQYKMQQVASVTSGRHFHAVAQSDLVNAFQEIAKSLPMLIVK